MSRSVMPLLVVSFLGLGLFSSPSQAPAKTDRPSNPAYHCSASIGVPLHVSLSTQGGSPLIPGGSFVVEARVTPGAETQSIEIGIEPDGALVLGSESASMPAPAAGESTVLPIQFQLMNSDRASVTVHVTALSADGSQTWERSETFFALLHDNRILSGMGSYLQLELQAVEEDLASGLLTEEGARAARKAITTLPGETNRNPISPIVRTPEEQELVDILTMDDLGRPKSNSTAALVTVQGNVQWRDENNNPHPAVGLTPQVWDVNGPVFLGQTTTDGNGNYIIGVDGSGRDIRVTMVTANLAVLIKPQGVAGPYTMDSPVTVNATAGSTITENFTFFNADPGPAANLCEAATWIAIYTAINQNGGAALPQINFEWPGAAGSANYNGTRINMRPGDRWDWDVLHHEYGHYIMDTFNFENNPGGPHNLGDCISDVQGTKDKGTRMAWGEGWPTYNGTVAQQIMGLAARNIPRVGDVSYSDTGESNFSYSLEAQDNLGLGEDNELAVQRIFWDLFDTPADGRDNVTQSDVTLFNVVTAANPTTLSAAWAAIRATLTVPEHLSYGSVATDHFVGPALTNPASLAIVPPGTNFSWTRGVGCSTTYDGDDFTMYFFDAGTDALLLSIPVGNTTSHALTLGEYQTLVASNHFVKWAVEGSNGDAPATGPYLGENLPFIANRPPVANAGADATEECTSSTTTPVVLDGTGSSDPDGDALFYKWEPAALFVDQFSPTPTGNFPKGITNVTLTVSDGIEQDTDVVKVTIVDTTPPMVTCPSDTTVECSDHCEGGGVPKGDAQLTDFFAGFSSVDVCDTTPTESNDAPACFPLGTTTVTFKSCDDDNNCRECTADVTVVDTTPPEITVELNRDSLWPPNHKMASITAEVTVTDICDPNPTFVLTSIESNEPDNGLGDGDTADDIQEHALGTPDVDFLLRSERAGGGSGRKYTIIYTAMDMSGNTARDTVCVTVPHDQSGHALASSGFNSTGTAFSADAQMFRVIVLSRQDLEASRINTRFALIGNTIDAIRPLSTRLVDLNGDRRADLELLYSVSEVQQLRSMSTKKDGMGLHYHMDTEESWLVKDIFALGAPLALVDDSPEDKNPITPEVADTDDPGQVGGQVVVTDSGRLQFTTQVSGMTQVEVFNVAGRKVRTLIHGDLGAGSHDLEWNGQDESGRRLPSGIYFYRIQMPDRQEVIKIRMVR